MTESNPPILVDGQVVDVRETEVHDTTADEVMAETDESMEARSVAYANVANHRLFGFKPQPNPDYDGQVFLDHDGQTEQQAEVLRRERQSIIDSVTGVTREERLAAHDKKVEAWYRGRLDLAGEMLRKSVKPYEATLPFDGPIAAKLSVFKSIRDSAPPPFVLELATQWARQGDAASYYVRPQMEKEYVKPGRQWAEMREPLREYLKIPATDPLSVQRGAEDFYRRQYEFVAARALGQMRALARLSGE